MAAHNHGRRRSWLSVSLLLFALAVSPASSLSAGVLPVRGGQQPAVAMMARKVLYAGEAREALMAGVNKVADAVKVTIGPRGRNVVIRPTGKMPAVVNDGVTIAGEVNLESIPENVGVKLLLQAASQTDSRAGDGTTTATVLTQAIMREGIRLTSSGHNAVALQKGLLKAAAFFSAKIRELAEPVTTYEQYKQIASISANSDELGAHTADAIIKALPLRGSGDGGAAAAPLHGGGVSQVGLDGATIIEDGVEMHDEVTVSEGMELEARRLCLAAGLPRRLVCTSPAPPCRWGGCRSSSSRRRRRCRPRWRSRWSSSQTSSSRRSTSCCPSSRRWWRRSGHCSSSRRTW